MKMLEIDEIEFINLHKVIRVKIKDKRLVAHNVPEVPEFQKPEPFIPGYSLEFELDNRALVKSKDFVTVEEAKMWLFEHTK